MRLIALAAAAALLGGPALAHPGHDEHAAHAAPAAKAHFHAMLTGAAQVPPVAGAGKGVADAWYDAATKTLSWKVTYEGLTGPVSAAHIHGPAAEGANAGVMIMFASTASPIEGSAVLTDDQAAALSGGLLYVNLHTDAHPTGKSAGSWRATGRIRRRGGDQAVFSALIIATAPCGARTLPSWMMKANTSRGAGSG